MMSDNRFSDTGPEKDESPIRDANPRVDQKATVETGSKENHISSKEYEDITPFYASQYGVCRLFTARNNGRRVIIKTLKAAFAGNKGCQATLRQEYDATGQLENKYVRRALDFVKIEGLGDCIIFEYVEGTTLAEHVRVGTLSERQVKSILIEICEGLHHMHQRGVYHCNIMPDNILVTDGDCRAKIIDIGMAEMDFSKDRELLVKEMEFNAPEVIKGEDPDARSDVFSLGKIMDFIGERNITQSFNSIATHCTQFSREQRFDTVAEVKSALKKSRSSIRIVLVILLLALLGVLAYYFVPKFQAKAKQEKTKRMHVEFRHEVDKIRSETASLCQKYKLTALSAPTHLSWDEDSLRYRQQLSSFMGDATLRAEADLLLSEQREAVVSSRLREYDQLLLTAFRNAQDSIAILMKTETGEAGDSATMGAARRWHDFSLQKEAAVK